MKRLVIGTDHRGYALKTFLCTQQIIATTPITWIDVGCYSAVRCDYPLFAQAAVKAILAGKADGGVLLCGSGVGMSIAANRFNGIYAALVWCEAVAVHAKRSDNANVLVLPADFIDQQQALLLVRAWLQASFAGAPYQARIDQLDHLVE